jgi:hypothetical protein
MNFGGTSVKVYLLKSWNNLLNKVIEELAA